MRYSYGFPFIHIYVSKCIFIHTALDVFVICMRFYALLGVLDDGGVGDSQHALLCGALA